MENMNQTIDFFASLTPEEVQKMQENEPIIKTNKELKKNFIKQLLLSKRQFIIPVSKLTDLGF